FQHHRTGAPRHGDAEFAGLDPEATRASIAAGRRVLSLAGVEPRGFVAPAYAYTPALRSELAAGLAPTRVGPGQLEQVLVNLALNARDAMPDGGRLRVRTLYDEAAGEVVVEVADTGHGIAPEHLAHVFDPFFTTKPSGAGLGLAVCYGIVTAHGGRIEVAPGDEGGTVARVALPAGTAMEGAGAAEEAGAKSYEPAAAGRRR
ncbi:MAG TPA: ATP-binding protein, partial [Pyrinomonadaceae bacterium]|nr:ATP-binding protein [Pyrinomonadaceae bacterium]